MASAIRPDSQGPRREETTFSRNLRYEWTSEEGRAQLGSYAISIGLAIIWLAVVHLYRPTVRPHLIPEARPPIEVTYQDVPMPEPTPIPPAPQAGEATQVAVKLRAALAVLAASGTNPVTSVDVSTPTNPVTD